MYVLYFAMHVGAKLTRRKSKIYSFPFARNRSLFVLFMQSKNESEQNVIPSN